MTKNPYTVLGVSESAGADEIKSAYRKKAKENHPDLHPDDPNATERMNEINEAYSILSNPEKLAAYKAQQQAEAYGSNPYGGNPFSSAYSGSSAPYGSYENPYGRTTGNGQTYYYYYNSAQNTDSSRKHTYQYRRPSLLGGIARTVVTFVVLRWLFRLLFGGGIIFFPFFFF